MTPSNSGEDELLQDLDAEELLSDGFTFITADGTNTADDEDTADGQDTADDEDTADGEDRADGQDTADDEDTANGEGTATDTKTAELVGSLDLVNRPAGARRDSVAEPEAEPATSEHEHEDEDDGTDALDPVEQLSVDEWLAQATVVDGTDAVDFTDAAARDRQTNSDALVDGSPSAPPGPSGGPMPDQAAPSRGRGRRGKKRRKRRSRGQDRQAVAAADEAANPAAETEEITGTSMSEIMAEMLAAAEQSSEERLKDEDAASNNGMSDDEVAPGEAKVAGEDAPDSADAQAGEDTDTDTGTDTDTDTDPGTDTDTESEPGSEAEAEAEADQDSSTDVKPESESDDQSESETKSETETETESKPDDKSKADGKSKAKDKSEADGKSKAKAKSEEDGKSKAKAKSEEDDEPEAKSTSGDEPESDSKTEDPAKPTAPDGDDAAASPAPAKALQTDAPVEPKTAGPTALGPPAGTGGRGKTVLVGALLAVAAVYVLLGAVWALDTLAHRDEAMRGVRMVDVAVGGSDRAALQQTIGQLDEDLTQLPLDITVGDVDVSSDPATLGLRLDGEPMIEDALAARRGGFILARPINWFFNLFSSENVEARYMVDKAAAASGSDKVITTALDEAVEPELALNGSAFALVPGANGTAIDSGEIATRLPTVVSEGEPYQLELTALTAEPALGDETIVAIADELNEKTSEPIAVEVLDQRVEVSPRMLKSWISLDTTGDEPGWTLDEAMALDDLKPLFPALGAEDQQARFSVVDEEPIIIPASETVICCEAGAGETLVTTINRPIPTIPVETDEDGNPIEPEESEDSDDAEPVEQPLRRARLQPAITGEDEGVAELESLGIVEQVSTFTTPHACCQNRVINIQRFADLMQGVIIRPGEEFSLNEYVGRRTTEKGFVADGAIVLGNFEPQVGGGISQYATTFFNASFFAGIEFLEYQSHSIYISRYPRGREATISWRRPDLKVKNNTDYGILVWNEYTDTSITVSFYSTKHREVEALPLRRSSDRKCRIDITPRVITFPDGTEEEDRVFASYRPGQGLDCNGNSTTPEEDEEDEPAPAEQATAPTPTPTPGPEPPPDDGGDTGTDSEADPDTDVLPPGG